MKNNKLWATSYKLIISFVGILLSIILVFYLINCSLRPLSYNFILSLFLLGLFYLGSYALLEKILTRNEKIFIVVLLGGSILIYTVWNIIANSQPVSDYEVLINGAKQFIQGNFAKLSFAKDNYFYFYNFQTGYVIYLAFLMKMLGTSLIGLKVGEILLQALSNLLVYLIARNIYNKKVGLVASLLYSTFLFNIGGSSIINNQHLNILFILLSLYLISKYLKKDQSNLAFGISGLLLALSFIVRQSALVFVMAIILLLILEIIENYQKWLKYLQKILILIIVFSLSLFTYDSILKVTHLVPSSALVFNAKYFKYILGVYDRGITGAYTTSAYKTNVYYDLKNYNFDYDKYNIASREFLKRKYTKEIKTTIAFIARRLYSFTSDVDNQIEFAVNANFKNGGLYKIIVNYGYTEYVFELFMALISLVLMRKKNNNLKDQNMFVFWQIVFIGFFLCHLIMESQSRYRYDQYLALAFLASPSVTILINNIKNKFKI